MCAKTILISGGVMLALDFIYLSLFSDFFNKLVGSIQGTRIKFNPIGAIICYILLIMGLHFFIIDKKRPLIEAFILGIVIYGVYESTNYAIFKNWTAQAMALDTLWGGVLFTLTTKLTYMFK